MKHLKNLLFEDISKFEYFMTAKEIQNYQKYKVMFALVALLIAIFFGVFGNFTYLKLSPLLMFGMYKIPYIAFSLTHRQNCNNVVSAIPIWLNQFCAYIESENIHNAIKKTLSDSTPVSIKKDLADFIERIDYNSEDKEAYVGFLKRYKINDFENIMLKLFEYRNLSKDRIKYEIHTLNKDINKIESVKRKNVFKQELFLVDTVFCFYLGIPSFYITFVALLPNLFAV